MTLETYLTFCAVCAIFVISPGPDNIFTLTNSVSYGKRAGFACATGIIVGNIVHITFVVTGLVTILQQSAALFNVIKWMGAAYLLYLAARTFMNRKRSLITTAVRASSPGGFMMRGLLTCLMNPKVSLFFVAFFPQFIPLGESTQSMAVVVLGATHVFIASVLFALLVWASSFVADWLRAKPQFELWMQNVSASIFLGLGVRLLFQERPR